MPLTDRNGTTTRPDGTGAGSDAGGALAGLRVLDLSRVVAGPYCTQTLADHGANVIKVEPPVGDETRRLGRPLADGSAPYFHGLNRNKRAIVLDLARADDRDRLLALAADADVLIENFLAGTMARFGLDYERDLAPRFPRLIYCAISGFGARGPLAGLPGYDAIAQAAGGLMSINGDPASGPVRVGLPLVDLATGMSATIGILLALAERARSGRGQRVDTALFDNALALLHPHGAEWLLAGRLNGLTGHRHPVSAPYEPFVAAGGAPVFIGVVNDKQFAALLRALGLDALAGDPRFQGLHARLENRDAMHEAIQSAIADEAADALCTRLMRAGVPAGPIHSVAEALSHPQATAAGMRVELPGGYQGVGIAARLSRTPGSVRTPPPALDGDGPDIAW